LLVRGLLIGSSFLRHPDSVNHIFGQSIEILMEDYNKDDSRYSYKNIGKDYGV